MHLRCLDTKASRYPHSASNVVIEKWKTFSVSFTVDILSSVFVHGIRCGYRGISENMWSKHVMCGMQRGQREFNFEGGNLSPIVPPLALRSLLFRFVFCITY